MIRLSTKDNIDNTDPNYPFGKSVDDTGTDNGSRINFQRLNDAEQLMEKVFDESGLVANGLPDNNLNTFQLFDAFKKVFKGFDSYSVKLTQTGTSDPVVTLLNNDTGFSVAVTRTGAAGRYEANFGGSFVDASKVQIFVSHSSDSAVIENVNAYLGGAPGIVAIDSFNSAGSLADDVLKNTALEVRIYP